MLFFPFCAETWVLLAGNYLINVLFMKETYFTFLRLEGAILLCVFTCGFAIMLNGYNVYDTQGKDRLL